MEVGDQGFNLRPTSGAEQAISKPFLSACSTKDRMIGARVDTRELQRMAFVVMKIAI